MTISRNLHKIIAPGGRDDPKFRAIAKKKLQCQAWPFLFASQEPGLQRQVLIKGLQ